jgi:hypothetical protein
LEVPSGCGKVGLGNAVDTVSSLQEGYVVVRKSSPREAGAFSGRKIGSVADRLPGEFATAS